MSDTLPSHFFSAAEQRPDIISQMGIIAVRWAALDSTLVSVLSAIVGDYHTADVIYFSLHNFGSRLDVIRNLVTEVVPPGPKRDATLAALNRVERLAKTRNYLIHSAMGLSVEDDRVFQMRRRPGSEKRPFESVEIKPADLAQHAHALHIVASELMRLAHPMPHLLQRRASE